MSDVLYFAYGSNMSTQSLRRKGVTPRASEAAELHGYKLTFNLRFRWLKLFGALATISPEENGVVYGVLHTIPSSALRILDIWECVFIKLYQRRRVLIRR